MDQQATGGDRTAATAKGSRRARTSGASRDTGGVRSVWLRENTRTERREPPLTRERIVTVAVALLDAEGVDRLTMRRLAEWLDVGTTTLYWHVSTKDDVIDLAVDSIFDTAAIPTAPLVATWRDGVHELLVRWRATMLAHPWSAGLPARRRPSIGPNFLTWMEFLQSTLAAAGFRVPALSAATWALHNHVMGAVAAQTNLQLSTAEREVGQEQLKEQGRRYPTLVENGYLLDADWDGAFERGLGYLLDGLAAQIDR